jgi:hypothetical protein
MLPDAKGPDKFKTTRESIELAIGELKFAQKYLSGFQFNMWLAGRMPGFTVISPAPHLLRIAHDGAADDFTLDPATWLPIKTGSKWPRSPNKTFASTQDLNLRTSQRGPIILLRIYALFVRNTFRNSRKGMVPGQPAHTPKMGRTTDELIAELGLAVQVNEAMTQLLLDALRQPGI